MALRTEESRTQGAGREEREEGVDLGVCRAGGYATHRGSWKPKSIDIDKRPDRKFRQGFIGALSATGSQTSDKLPCLLLGVGGLSGRTWEIWCTKWGEGRLGPALGGRAECQVCPQAWCAVCRHHVQDPILVLQLQRGDWSFDLFSFFISCIICPSCSCM